MDKLHFINSNLRARSHTLAFIYFAENQANCNFQSVLISLIGFVAQHQSNYVCIYVYTMLRPFLFFLSLSLCCCGNFIFIFHLFCLARFSFHSFQSILAPKMFAPRNKHERERSRPNRSKWISIKWNFSRFQIKILCVFWDQNEFIKIKMA